MASHNPLRRTRQKVMINLLQLLYTVTILLTLPKRHHAFQYKLPSQDITAPEMFCFSGDVAPTATIATTSPQSDPQQQQQQQESEKRDNSLPCPTTPEEVANYPAVVMDEAGYVSVVIRNVIMRDDGRRRSMNPPGNGGHNRRTKKKKKDVKNAKNVKTTKNSKNNETIPFAVTDVGGGHSESPPSHHLQIYLVPLEDYASIVNTSICCYEFQMTNPPNATLPPECVAPKPRTGNITSSSALSQNSSPGSEGPLLHHDYRIHAPRIGQTTSVSAPIIINNDVTNTGGVDIIAKLRPTRRGRHMVVISNCAAELKKSNHGDGDADQTFLYSAKALKAVLRDGLEITFASQFGELPLSMMGIIPFYGALAGAYGALALVWRFKSRFVGMRHHDARAAPLLGLQKAIKYCVLGQFFFSSVAFAYYLHLNAVSVDVEVLYSGTAAALISWGPWSIMVAIAHFVTIFGCQCVVTLATDGTWLIQNNIRRGTKCALYFLAMLWLVYFACYGVLDIIWRRRVFMIGGFCWILFLMFNLRNSLRHLKSLVIGQSEDVVLAIGGAIVAKRSLYRKMFFIVAMYPLVFLGSMFLTAWQSREDSWAWVGYVLGDVYLFIILIHASYIWMPRPMASHEYVKYAPLELDIVADDSEMWETGSFDVDWNEDEITEIELT